MASVEKAPDDCSLSSEGQQSNVDGRPGGGPEAIARA